MTSSIDGISAKANLPQLRPFLLNGVEAQKSQEAPCGQRLHQGRSLCFALFRHCRRRRASPWKMSG